MGSVAYQKKEVIHLQLDVGDSLVKMMDLACNTAGISTDDLNQFTITAIAMLSQTVVELTMVYIHDEE